MRKDELVVFPEFSEARIKERAPWWAVRVVLRGEHWMLLSQRIKPHWMPPWLWRRIGRWYPAQQRTVKINQCEDAAP